MTNSIIVDASVLIAAVSDGEAGYADALELFQAIRARKAVVDVPATFLLEVYAALNRRPREIRKIGFFSETDPLHLNLRPVGEQQVQEIMEWMADHMGGKMPTRGGDLAYIGIAATTGLPLVTLDNGVRQFAEAGLQVLTPLEMLDTWSVT